MKKTIGQRFVSDWLPSLIVLVVLIGGLEIVTTGLGLVNPLVLPSPSSIVRETIAFFQLKNGDFTSTMTNSLLGYFLSVPAGIILAGLLAQTKIGVKATSPLIVMLAVTPLLVLVPILVMWTKFAPWTRTFAVAIQTTPIILLNTLTGFTNVPAEKEELARVYGASKTKRFFKIVVPQALPRIFTGLRMGVINSWMGIVGTEFIVLGQGLGHRILVGANFLKFPLVFGCILVIAISGYIMMSIVTTIEKRVVVWKQ